MLKVSNKKTKAKNMFKVNNKDTKQHKHQNNLIDVVLVSLLLTLSIILTFFSSVSNVVCEHIFFRLNMTTIMAVATTIYVNTTLIMTMNPTTTMIMTMTATKTMIMTMIATMTKNMTTTMAKDITTSVTTIFKQVQKDNFYCLLKKIKRL